MWRRVGVAVFVVLSLSIASPAQSQHVAPDCPSGPICSNAPLTLLSEILARTVADQKAAIEVRPKRLRQAEARHETWHRNLERKCGSDLGCLQRSYLSRINEVRGNARPLAWRFAGDGSLELAEAPPLGSIPSLPVVGLASELSSLIGYWRGATTCGGRDASVEIVIEPGYAGRLIGFIGAWRAEATAQAPSARDEFQVLSKADGQRYVLRLANSRIRRSGPHVRFGAMELIRDPSSQSIELTNAGGSCKRVILTRTSQSESLNAIISEARAVRNPRWSWPYDPLEIPAPADHAFCSALLAWADQYFDHYAEARPIQPDDLSPVAVLDLPGFVSLVGKPYDALSEQERKNFGERVVRSCAGTLVKRALQSHNSGVFALMRSQQGTAHHQRRLERLEMVRTGRAWMADRLTMLADLGDDAEDYPEVRVIEREAADILAPLLAGEIASFGDAVAAARTRSASAYAHAEIERLFASSQGTAALLLVNAAKVKLADAISDMASAASAAFSSFVDGHVDAVIARELPLRLAALNMIVGGEEPLAESRHWYNDFVDQFGGYRSNSRVSEALNRFRERRLQLVDTFAENIVSNLEGAESEGALTAYINASLIPAIDMVDQTVGPVYRARLAHFERERLLAGYSELEKSLADNVGLISVPATYPEPTEDEVALAVRRAYGRYGNIRRDGTFSYGVFRESAADMRVRDVEKSQCSREEAGGYLCTVKIDIEIRMPGAVSAALGSRDIRDRAMLYLQDRANAAPASFTKHVFVLTPKGWQSPTLMRGADAGIAAGLNTLGEVATGVGCTLADLDC